jgi:hypothetical protein
MSRGTVYVLINESMPNLVKIGMTTRSVNQRMAELYQTGVPTPFELYAEYDCPDCRQVESEVHNILDECRVSGSREFFVCPPEKAAQEVMDAHRHQVETWLEDFISDQEIVNSDAFVDVEFINFKMKRDDIGWMDIAQVLAEATPSELAPAVDRVLARRAASNLSVEASK